MKAVVFERFGGPEVLAYGDRPEPVAGPGEVLLRVRACGVNHLDLWVRAGLPGPDVWLILRRGVGENPERKVSLSNAPAHTPVAALVRVAGMRWPIETAFEESKGGLGLDHYEVRSWLGWHHHMTLCLLAHHFLVRARQRVKRERRP